MHSPEDGPDLTIDPEAQRDADRYGIPLQTVRAAAAGYPSASANYNDGLGDVYLIYAEGLILWVRIGIERRVLLVRRDAS